MFHLRCKKVDIEYDIVSVIRNVYISREFLDYNGEIGVLYYDDL